MIFLSVGLYDAGTQKSKGRNDMAEWEIKRLEREGRLTRETRSSHVFKLQMLALVVVLMAFAVLGFTFAPPAAEVPGTSIEVRIEAGDTLWEIAERYPVDGMGTEELVDHIARANDIEGGLLRIGTVVAVPHDTSFLVASR